MQVFHCPEVRVPQSVRRDGNGNFKRKFNDDSSKESRPQSGRDSKKPKTEKEEIRGFLTTIKQYANERTLEGRSLKAFKDHKLTKLGAAPPKQQTMPFAMKMGILAARKKRNIREKAEAKESGITQANAKIKNKHHKRH